MSVELSDEVMVAILRWLPAADLVAARLVSRDWHRLADDDLLWRPLVRSRWQALPQDETWAAATSGPSGFRGLYAFKCRFDNYWDHKVTLSWSSVDDPLRLRQTDQSAMGVIDDYVYIFGGRYREVEESNRLWIYSISNGKKVKGVVLAPAHGGSAALVERWPSGRIGSAGAVIGDRYLYVFGGNGQDLLNDLWVFDSVRQTWGEVEAKGDPPKHRWTQSLTAVGRRLFLFGGWTEDSNFNDLHIFDTETNTWSVGDVKGDIPPPIGCHTASLVGKYIFIYGGDDAQLRMYNDVYRLDTESLCCEKLEIKGVVERRESHADIVVGNHIIYYGGQCVGPADDSPRPVEARRRGASFVAFNTDTLTFREMPLSGDPVGLNWHKMSFVGNRIQVWFGATEDPLPPRRSIGIVTLTPRFEEQDKEGKGKCSLQ